jgi:ATP:corrinoid adenosyltransferase
MESPPREKPYTRPDGERRGLLMVNTGNGKGKTTAAIGLAVRALGRGKSVRFFQFMKVGVARCPPEIIEIADTVTDMQVVKHAFAAGIPAQRGIEH